MTALTKSIVTAGLPAFVACSLAFADPSGFTTSARQLLLNGQPFQVRGVSYQPTPVGQNPSAAAPYGDYYTAGYATLAARDLPLLRQLGANVIRVYGWDPSADHTAFLDACYNGGVDPVYVLINRWINPATSWSDSTAVNAIRQEFLSIDAGVANHPAVLGIVLGNEANNANGNGGSAAFWTAMNSIAASIKSQNPARLVSVAITDALSQVTAFNASMTSLDFWCVQVYRGTTFGTFFTQYSTSSGKPLVVSEFGIDAFDNGAAAAYANNGLVPANTLAGLWTEMAGRNDVCSGGCVFEFSDEWWKATGSASAHDNGGFSGGSTDGFLNEEWFGLFAVSNTATSPNELSPRASVAALAALWKQAPAFTADPSDQAVTAGDPVAFSAAASGTPMPAIQWQSSADNGGSWTDLADDANYSGVTTGTLSIATATLSQNGYRFRAAASNSAGTATSSAALLTVNAPTAPTITTQPSAQPVVAGATVTFAADASGPGPLAYQWRKNGVNITGATSASLTLSSVTAANAGNYSVVITNAYGSVVSNAAALSVGTDSRLVNLSTRAYAGSGDATLILGFFISGNGTKTLIIRGIGPKLADFITTPVVADPSIVVYSGDIQVATNNDWDSSLASDFSVVGAFALNPGSKDAALKLDLGPGLYTVHMLNPGAVAEGLIEIYDRSLDAGTRLTNLSCRLKIVQGQTVIVGTYLLGSGSNIVARNVGPGLSPYVLDTERPFLLPDPMLRYYDGTDTLMGENNDWDAVLATDFTAVGAFPIATGGKDAAAKLPLTPGRYSFHASGNSSGGVILVELYQAP